jgi:hypothetical protein
MDTDGALCADPRTGKYEVHMDEALRVSLRGASDSEPGQVTTSRSWRKWKQRLTTAAKVVANVALQLNGVSEPIFPNP